MGFLRTLYNFIGIEYIGSKELFEIDRQKHLKYLMCKQIKDSNIKLFKIVKYTRKRKNKK